MNTPFAWHTVALITLLISLTLFNLYAVFHYFAIVFLLVSCFSFYKGILRSVEIRKLSSSPQGGESNEINTKKNPRQLSWKQPFGIAGVLFVFGYIIGIAHGWGFMFTLPLWGLGSGLLIVGLMRNKSDK